MQGYVWKSDSNFLSSGEPKIACGWSQSKWRSWEGYHVTQDQGSIKSRLIWLARKLSSLFFITNHFLSSSKDRISFYTWRWIIITAINRVERERAFANISPPQNLTLNHFCLFLFDLVVYKEKNGTIDSKKKKKCVSTNILLTTDFNLFFCNFDCIFPTFILEYREWNNRKVYCKKNYFGPKLQNIQHNPTKANVA